jgi:predicted proteasome-type protease
MWVYIRIDIIYNKTVLKINQKYPVCDTNKYLSKISAIWKQTEHLIVCHARTIIICQSKNTAESK